MFEGVGEGVGEGVTPGVGTGGRFGGSAAPSLPEPPKLPKVSLFNVSCPKTGMEGIMGRKNGVMMGTRYVTRTMTGILGLPAKSY